MSKLTFKDLDKPLPDGRIPLQEIAKEVALQQYWTPETGKDRELDPGKLFRTRYRKASKREGRKNARWEVEYYAHKYATGAEQEFTVYLVVSERLTVLELNSSDVVTYVPSCVPIYTMLIEMGYDVFGSQKPWK